jgi:penicillin-binding protein 1A
MSTDAQTPQLGRGRKRRAARRPHLHWGRLAIIVVIVAVVALLAGLTGTIVAVSRTLPNIDSMKQTRLGQTTVIYDRSGHKIAELYGAINRIIVPSRSIPTVMKNATVAIEDRRFYEHHGVDFTGIARAFVQDVKAGHVVQGASTITEQYVKNAYLGDDITLSRKLREAVLAWQLEDRWSKDKILTEYLNTVYYGAGAYGVQAASLTYFHKPVSQVTLPQAALLAALPKFPSEYSPITDPKIIKQRRNLVLDNMAQLGYITPTRAATAEASKVKVFDQPPATRKNPAAYFVDYVTRQLVDRYGSRETFEGGLRVYTSLDMRMQQDGIDTLNSTLPAGPAGALVSIDPANGYIRTMAASTDWKHYKYNLTWQSKRQPGSAMKPFALVGLVEAGANPATTYYVSHPLHIPWAGEASGFWDVWTFEHSTGQTRMNMVTATLKSDNTVYAQLAMDLGPDKIVKTAHQMGITSPLQAVPSIVLGSEEVNPLEMADAYATLANGGVHHKPQSIERVVFPSRHVDKTKIKGNRVMSAGVAYTVNKILEQNTYGGTGAGVRSYYSGVAAGKTGTTTDSADAWFCGYNPDLATAIWMGYPQDRIAMPGVQGATYCVPMFGKYYAAVFGTSSIPGFVQPAIMPLWKPWNGKYSKLSPSPSPSPSKSKTKKPKPGPTSTYTAHPSPTPTHPTPTPTHTKPPPTTPPPTTPPPSP